MLLYVIRGSTLDIGPGDVCRSEVEKIKNRRRRWLRTVSQRDCFDTPGES